jgi:hypothetical protein
MNLELNTLMVAVFFAPMALLVLANVMDLAGTGYKAKAISRPAPRPATMGPRFEAANDANVRLVA